MSFVSEVTGDKFLKIEEDLGDGFVRLKIGEADERQARHDIRSVENIAVELLRNSRDAGSNIVFFATSKEKSENRHITLVDDGEGIPVQLHEKIFEPRVTSRLLSPVEDHYGVHGRGMALYAIRRASRRCRIAFSAPRRGCCIHVEIETSELPEKKDQSSIPGIKRERGGRALVGPHNLPRIAVEFALANPGLEIFFGSPAEILSTMYWLSRPLVGNKSFGELLVNPDVKFWQCIGCVTEASKLSAFAGERLGLAVSERNASRIIGQKIEPLPRVDRLLVREECDERKPVVLSGGLPAADRITREDLRAFAEDVRKCLGTLGDKYFLKGRVCEVKKDGNRIKVVVELSDEELDP
ncbi:MAG: ATP-binding protein [Candidatus Aquicultorales bacterium]